MFIQGQFGGHPLEDFRFHSMDQRNQRVGARAPRLSFATLFVLAYYFWNVGFLRLSFLFIEKLIYLTLDLHPHRLIDTRPVIIRWRIELSPHRSYQAILPCIYRHSGYAVDHIVDCTESILGRSSSLGRSGTVGDEIKLTDCRLSFETSWLMKKSVTGFSLTTSPVTTESGSS